MKVLQNLEIRRKRYEHFVLRRGKFSEEFPAPEAIILGDRPGPSAPTDPSYHHTPFYSTKHCSGWLNALLFLEGFDENELVWVNAFNVDGSPTHNDVVENLLTKFSPQIIALGGNAEKWLKQNNYPLYVKVDHPQYHKRFKNKQPYPFVTELRSFVKEPEDLTTF